MIRRLSYKLELISIKYIPILIAAIYLLSTILYYYDIELIILDDIADTSILTTIPMYISSYVYKFCKYHRMFIHYILVCNFLTIYDNYIGIPVDDTELFIIFMSITGIFSFITLYLYLKYGDRNSNESIK